MARSRILARRIVSPDAKATAVANSVVVVSENSSAEHCSTVHQTATVKVSSEGGHSSSASRASAACNS
jgi:hypothetical protein